MLYSRQVLTGAEEPVYERNCSPGYQHAKHYPGSHANNSSSTDNSSTDNFSGASHRRPPGRMSYNLFSDSDDHSAALERFRLMLPPGETATSLLVGDLP